MRFHVTKLACSCLDTNVMNVKVILIHNVNLPNIALMEIQFKAAEKSFTEPTNLFYLVSL